MRPVLQVTLAAASLSYGQWPILDTLNLNLVTGTKTALTGANGSGKTTLLRVIAGELAPDSGRVFRDRGLRISYLPQTGLHHSGCTLYEEVEKAFDPAKKLACQIDGLEQELARQTERSVATQRLLARHHAWQEKLAASDYHRRQQIIDRVLTGLSFQREDFGSDTARFSDGWQMRIALARVLCESAHLLLLDEPTNYLDLEARNWLENFIQEFGGGLVIVSHDRYFLDVTVSSVAELYRGKVTIHPGTFSEYEQRKSKERARLSSAYLQQQVEIDRLQTFIRRFRYKATKARQVQSRVLRLEQMERIEHPPNLKGINFSFPDPPPSGRRSCLLDSVTKKYGSKTVLERISLEIERGQRLVLVGPNGAGKSTLMRIMANREDASAGQVLYGSGVRPGYFSPDAPTDEAETTRCLIELAESWAPAELIPKLRSLLGAFLFREDEIYKPVSVLSGGEKSRLNLLKLLLQPTNLLFLDEPTNHLDISSKEILLQALTRYQGTLVFVSHDRYFIETLATRVLELNQGRGRLYYGDYAYYLWRKEQDALTGQLSEVPAKSRQNAASTVQSTAAKSDRMSARLNDKSLKSSLRRLERREAEILARLDELQNEAASVEQAMSLEHNYRDGQTMRQLSHQLAANRAEQHTLLQRWEELEKQQRLLGRGV